MAGGHTFDEKSVQRIIRSVLSVERRRKNEIPESKPNVRRGFSVENFRLIRGQSVGEQSGTVINIDNVIVLAGGIDPTNGNTGSQIAVSNWEFIPGQIRAFIDNQWIDAIYSPEVTFTEETGTVDWETLEAGTAGAVTEKFRLVRGNTKGVVSPTGTTFLIDSVIPLSSGLDPVSGSALPTLLVQKLQTEEFADNTPITAIYEPTGTSGTGVTWELLLTERFRLLRGEYYAQVEGETDVIELANVDILASGIDPREDPLDVSERVMVRVVDEALFNAFIGQTLYAAYNRATAITTSGTAVNWELLPTGTGGGGTEKYRLIQGLTSDLVTAFTGSFNVTAVEALANGLDPSGGNPLASITVDQTQKESFIPAAPIAAISDGTGTANWRTLAVERHRMIRGDYVGTANVGEDIIRINNIEVLASGLDPRVDATSGTEQVYVRVIDDASFTGTPGNKIYAAFNYGVGDLSGTSVDWEKLPSKPNSSIVIGTTTGVVSADAATFQITNLELVQGVLPSSPLTVNQVFPAGYAEGQAVMAFQGYHSLWSNTPEAGKVRTSNIDMLPEYLYDSLVNQAVFQTGTHQEVYAEENHVGGNNYRVRLFTGSGGSSSGTGGYCIENSGNQHHFNAITNAAGQQAAGIDTANQQFMVHFSGANSRDDASWKTGSGYNSGAGPDQFLINKQGDWNWEIRKLALTPNDGDTDDTVTINSVVGILLNLNPTNLEVVLQYQSYKVFAASSGGAASFTDNVSTGTCEPP